MTTAKVYLLLMLHSGPMDIVFHVSYSSWDPGWRSPHQGHSDLRAKVNGRGGPHVMAFQGLCLSHSQSVGWSNSCMCCFHRRHCKICEREQWIIGDSNIIYLAIWKKKLLYLKTVYDGDVNVELLIMIKVMFNNKELSDIFSNYAVIKMII